MIFERMLAAEGITVFVASDSERGALVGSASLVVVPNPTYGGRPWAVVENVVVARELRGRGIGRRLVEAAIEKTRRLGCYKVQLISGPKPEQKAFYKALRFDSANCPGHRMYFDR